MSILAEQIRAGLYILRWSKKRLAEETGIKERTIHRIASFDGLPSTNPRNLEAIKSALTEGNDLYRLEFIDNGVLFFPKEIKEDTEKED